MITPAYSPTATERVLPRLALDFTTGVLDPRVTVTRALNTATRVNSSGLIEIVNADLPRFDYDPITLAPRGLLIEETRANIALQSEDFGDVVWTKTATGTGVAPQVTTNAAISPDGTQNADLIVFDRGAGNASTDQSRLRQTITVTNATQYAGSFFVKAATVSDVGKQIAFRHAAGAGFLVITLTSDWVRIPRIETSISTSAIFEILNRGTVTADNSVSVNLYGAQLEAGAFATSYIPTTTTSLTRNADVVSMTGTNFSSWYNQSEGTFAALASFPVSDGANSRPVLNISSAGSSSEEFRFNFSGVGLSQLVVVDNGATQVNMTNANVASSTSWAAFAYKQDSFALAAKGTAPTLDTAGTLPTPDTLKIGSSWQPALCGTFKKVLYWPQRLTNNEVQAFSK